jgi:hypothetical protein
LVGIGLANFREPATAKLLTYENDLTWLPKAS